jgi:hypothetical protein
MKILAGNTTNLHPVSESDIDHDFRNQPERDGKHDAAASGCDIGSKATKQGADNYGIASGAGTPAFENEALRPNVVALADRIGRSASEFSQNLT